MSVSRLAALVEAEQARNDAVRAARRRRDAAMLAYRRAQRLLMSLENDHRPKSEVALKAARDAVQRTGEAFREAQRELLRSIRQ